MVPDWLHYLSLAALLIAVITAAAITIDLMAHPQAMWIMDVVWPVTALFGGPLVLAQYLRYGRLATHAGMHAAVQRHESPPNRTRTPFPAMAANGTLHCGGGCTLGDVCAEALLAAWPALALWAGWHTLFGNASTPIGQ